MAFASYGSSAQQKHENAHAEFRALAAWQPGHIQPDTPKKVQSNYVKLLGADCEMAWPSGWPPASKVTVLTFLTLNHLMTSFRLKEFVDFTVEVALQANSDANAHGPLHHGTTLDKD